MPPTPPSIVDTRMLFRPVSSSLVPLLRDLAPEAWARPTIAGAWTVRDVVAHLVDLTFRRLSFHRDGMAPPPPSRPIASASDFVAFINDINRAFVETTRRFSPQVLTDMFEKGSTDLADFFERLPLDAPALFGVSWAGETTSDGWFDVGREFVELWHHQAQIRLATGAEPLRDPSYLRAVLAVGMRGVPHAYRGVDARPGAQVIIDIAGDAGGTWTVRHEEEGWRLLAGRGPDADALVKMTDEHAWRLLCNALPAAQAAAAVDVSGDAALAARVFSARAVIV